MAVESPNLNLPKLVFLTVIWVFSFMVKEGEEAEELVVRVWTETEPNRSFGVRARMKVRTKMRIIAVWRMIPITMYNRHLWVFFIVLWGSYG